ncbi:MAG: 4-coumarate--CoA ligase [Pseudomonadota bacterium]
MNARLLDRQQALRLCIALISDFQTERIRAQRMSQTVHVSSALSREQFQSFDEVPISDDVLGIDSLALLDLVSHTSNFFGLYQSGIDDYLLINRTIGEWADLVAKHFQITGDKASISLSSSGTTGIKKAIFHHSFALLEETSSIVATLKNEPGIPRRILSFVSPIHMYGFVWGVLLPKALNIEVKDLSEASLTSLQRNTKTGDLVLATPFHWERFASFGQSTAPGVTGVSSAAPADTKTWDAARAVGLTTLIEVYGSTETGGVGWRTDPKRAMHLLPHLIRCGDEIKRRSSKRPICLQDRLEWTCAHEFRLKGRLDHMVQVAGANVSLSAVEQLLHNVTSVASASVKVDGDRLKAFIVPKGTPSRQLETELRSAVKHLPPAARPDRFTFGDQLPRNSMGKLANW